MDKKILEFAGLLRRTGLKVSHQEVADCLRSLALTGWERENFYNVLAATLLKDYSNIRVFDKLFDIFFDQGYFGHLHDSEYSLWPRQRKCSQDCSAESGLPGNEQGRSTGFGVGQGLATQAIDSFMHVIRAGTDEDLHRMVRKGVESLGQLNRRDLAGMKEAVRQIKVFLEWNMGVFRLEQESGLVDESTRLEWQDRLRRMEELLYRELERDLINELGEEALEIILIQENLNQIDFYKLSKPQVAEIKKRIGKLAHKLASRMSFRQRRANRGCIDLQKTIRRSMATGGVPIRPTLRDRYPTRPEIVVLCDLSGSVRVFSEFMLQLVYSIQNRFIHVRSFVFVDTPDEVTGYMQKREIEDGIREIYNKSSFSKTAFSNYGEMFIDFCSKYMDAVNKKVTLLIIGDARNNYQREHLDYFRKMCGEVKKVIWLNPEPAENWDREDSVMSVYGSLCTQVFECRNLEQLDRVSRNII